LTALDELLAARRVRNGAGYAAASYIASGVFRQRLAVGHSPLKHKRQASPQPLSTNDPKLADIDNGLMLSVGRERNSGETGLRRVA